MTDDAKAKWRAKNAAAQKAIPVEVPDVGTLYVRALSVRDSDYIASLKNVDGAGYGIVMAGMLCDEDGQRLSEEDRAEWVEIFSEAKWDDYVLLTSAARGQKKEEGPDAGN